MTVAGRAPQGARGLKFLSEKAAAKKAGRAPQGARGLKLSLRLNEQEHEHLSRAPQGARGLKYMYQGYGDSTTGRAPQGARGLKCRVVYPCVGRLAVAPRKGRVG